QAEERQQKEGRPRDVERLGALKQLGGRLRRLAQRADREFLETLDEDVGRDDRRGDAPAHAGIIRDHARRMTMGSMAAARRAGAKQASAATTTTRSATETYVMGSVGAMSKRSDAIRRPSARAAPAPTTRPARTSPSPWRRTIATTSARLAPSAIRTAI